MQSSTDHHSSGVAELPLTSAQVEQLRTAVHTIIAAHRRRLNESEELFRSLASDSSIGASERQAARHAASTAFTICQRAGRALERIEDGTYGRCVAYDRPLPFERLEALPLAERCVSCPEP